MRAPARQTSRRNPLITGINITPLVDIVLVLLVVLMVVSTYIVSQSMRVDLPNASASEVARADPITLTILRDGRLLLDDQPILEAAVEGALTQVFGSGASPAMIISADRAVPHGRVVQFVDLARRSGAARFAIKVAEER